MIRVVLLVLCMALVGVGVRYGVLYGGWRPLHGDEFGNAGCEHYHIMRGLEQNPRSDPANASLVQRCTRPRLPSWGLSQAGDALRFDRPAMVRLRVDVLDMQTQQYSNYPTFVLEFPYPAIDLPRVYRWRDWGGAPRALNAQERAALRDRWNPSWAPLFAEWSLGRGVNEVWLGGAAIADERYCLRVERPPGKPANCVMRVTTAEGKSVELGFLLDRPMEWRLEMMGLCRFGGQSRQWPQRLLTAWFGPVEYSDRGCNPF